MLHLRRRQRVRLFSLAFRQQNDIWHQDKDLPVHIKSSQMLSQVKCLATVAGKTWSCRWFTVADPDSAAPEAEIPAEKAEDYN
uniref:Uncharacterized protein n=1 Tax=Seriola dumerili TaxID=41447 RepID=A0A3B4VPD9_SERDU